MKCENGHECIKAPFTKGYYYCKVCQPREHRRHAENKKHRVAKMKLSKKPEPSTTFLNEFLEGFGKS